MFIAGFPLGALAANCYVVAAGPGRPCTVIDPGEAALPQVQAVVMEQGLTVNVVLLTHGHLDHAAGMRDVSQAYDVEGAIHPADEYMLDDPLSALSPELRSLLADFPIPAMRPEELILLERGDRLDVEGFELAVDLSPGHTGGSVVFRLDGTDDRPTILFTGDTLFAGSVGRTDLPGGSTGQLNASLDALLASVPDDAVILPGHGPTSTIGAERAGNPFLAGLGGRSRKRWFGA